MNVYRVRLRVVGFIMSHRAAHERTLKNVRDDMFWSALVMIVCKRMNVESRSGNDRLHLTDQFFFENMLQAQSEFVQLSLVD